MSDRELAIAAVGEVSKELGHLPGLIGFAYIHQRYKDAGVTSNTLSRMKADGLLKYHSHSRGKSRVNYELTDHTAWNELRAKYPPAPAVAA